MPGGSARIETLKLAGRLGTDEPIDDNELDGPENVEDELSEPNEPSLGALERHVSGYGPDGYIRL